ncbi:MAG: hypothetical protein ACRC4M_02170 [Mycoplasma sp.]
MPQKKLNNKYIKYFVLHSFLLAIAFAILGVSLFFFITQFKDSFNSSDAYIFWMGFLMIISIIIGSGMILISLSLVAKSIFYMKMGYEFKSKWFPEKAVNK